MSTTNINTQSNVLNVSNSDVNELIESLKEKEQWICWSYEMRDGDETKVPKSPEGGYAKSNDPSTWTTYKRASKYAEMVSSIDGIGYMFTEEDTIMGIDLDDVRDPENGELVDWAQDVVETVDSYTEVSPSGTGLHIIAHGMIPSDGNNKVKFDDGTEIEMYDSVRFFTMSFDHAEGTPKTVKMRQDSISNIHDEYMADDEEDEEYTTPTSTEDLSLDDEELIEKAIDANDGRKFEKLWNGDTSMHNGDHSRADMALLTKLAFWTQGDKSQMERLFGQSGLCRDKWINREDYRERSIKNAISNCTEYYEPKTQNKTENIELQYDNEYLALHSDLIEDDGYKRFEEKKDGSIYPIQVTNYTINLNSVLIEEDGTKKWYLEINPVSNVESSYNVVVEPSIFNDIRKYKKEIQIGQTTVWNGSGKDLNEIRQIIAHQDAPTRKATTKIGKHGDELVTPDGTIRVDDKEAEHRYVPTGNAIDNKWVIDNIDDYDKEEVKNIVELLCKVRDIERGIPIIGFIYSTIFNESVKEFTNDEFPMLGIDGESGAGKTQLLRFVMKALGLDGSPFSADDTEFAHIKKLSSTTNIPIWMDEYKPTEIADYKLSNLKKLLRKNTQGEDATRGNKDMGQDVWNINAPVILSGEQGMRGNAENRRLIKTQLKKESAREGSPTNKAWVKLTGGSYKSSNGIEYATGYDAQEHAKAIHKFALENDITHDDWKKCEKKVYEILSKYNIEGIDGLELKSLIIVKLGISIYKWFANDIGANLDELPTNDEIEDSILYLAKQMGDEHRTNHVEEFFELISDAARSGWLRDERDYRVIKKGSEKEELHIKLRSCHQSVSQFMHNKGLTGYDILNNPDDYRKRLRDQNDNYVLDMSKVDTVLNRCIAIDMEQIENDIKNFESQSFY